MTGRTGMHMRRRTEGVCGNNAMQFCLVTVVIIAQLKEKMDTDSDSRELRDSSMVKRWWGQFTEGRTNFTTKTVVVDRPP